MKLIILLTSLMLVSCNSIESTCRRYGLATHKVEVIQVDHKIDSKSYTQTRFTCTP